MAEYIEREAAIEEAIDAADEWDGGYSPHRAALIRDGINAIPAADVRPVVRGKWLLEYEPNGKPYCFHCSVCDGDFHYIGISTKYDFCPNCGAVMEGS